MSDIYLIQINNSLARIAMALELLVKAYCKVHKLGITLEKTKAEKEKE